MMRSAVGGVTLIEMMLVIAIGGVLLALAAPSFREFIVMQRLKGIHAQLLTDMEYARTEAVARNTSVRVKFGIDAAGKTCYSIFTAVRTGTTASPFSLCNCLNTPACSVSSASDKVEELRTVVLSPDRRVSVLVPSFSTIGQVSQFSIEPATAGLVLDYAEQRGKTRPDLVSLDATIDCKRTMRVEVNQSGRSRACAPNGSTVSGSACATPSARTGC